MNTALELMDKVAAYRFDCEAGPLALCVDWIKLRATILSLESELRAAKLDAERYRWLRKPHNHVTLKVFVHQWMTFYGNDLDKHIDAALAAAPQSAQTRGEGT